MKYGFVKVAAAVPAVKVADVEYNVQQIESLIAQAEGRGIDTRVRTYSVNRLCSTVRKRV